ncbi:hypothetical protein F5I97DRAFT_1831633 [Phlebopus sp. FC_14]|nr:hypothetical protein F5I97DRAFT_1831633 [Phlebopus sp. FC_14]
MAKSLTYVNDEKQAAVSTIVAQDVMEKQFGEDEQLDTMGALAMIQSRSHVRRNDNDRMLSILNWIANFFVREAQGDVVAIALLRQDCVMARRHHVLAAFSASRARVERKLLAVSGICLLRSLESSSRLYSTTLSGRGMFVVEEKAMRYSRSTKHICPKYPRPLPMMHSYNVLMPLYVLHDSARLRESAAGSAKSFQRSRARRVGVQEPWRTAKLGIVGGQSFYEPPDTHDQSGTPPSFLIASYCWTNDAERMGSLIGTNSEELLIIAHARIFRGVGFRPVDFQDLWVVTALDSACRAVNEYLLTSGQEDKIPKFKKLWGEYLEWTTSQPSSLAPKDANDPQNLLHGHLGYIDAVISVGVVEI